MTEKYGFVLKPSLKPEEIGRLREAVGWSADVELYRQTLGKTYFWIGCFVDRELVGYVDVVSDGVADAYLRDLMVHPDHQRQGLGRRLVTLAVKQVRCDGIRMINVVFDPGLASFYQGLGFHLVAGGLVDFGAQAPVRIERFDIDRHDMVRTTEIFALSVGDPSKGLVRWLHEYYAAPYHSLFVALRDELIVGVLGIDHTDNHRSVIRHLAVHPQCQWQGVGRRLIEEVVRLVEARGAVAETDRESVGFYRACGFMVSSLGEKYPGVERFECVKEFGRKGG